MNPWRLSQWPSTRYTLYYWLRSFKTHGPGNYPFTLLLIVPLAKHTSPIWLPRYCGKPHQRLCWSQNIQHPPLSPHCESSGSSQKAASLIKHNMLLGTPCRLLPITLLTFTHQDRTSKRTCSINFVMPLQSCCRAATWWCWPIPLMLLETSHLDHLASMCPTCLSAPFLFLPLLWILPQRRLQPASGAGESERSLAQQKDKQALTTFTFLCPLSFNL